MLYYFRLLLDVKSVDVIIFVIFDMVFFCLGKLGKQCFDFGYLVVMNIDKIVFKNDIYVGNDL